MDAKAWIEERRALVEARLEQALPAAHTSPKRLHEAMRHSVFAGGKRLRPLLCLAAAEAVSTAPEAEDVRRRALPAACALEMVHTYSLIHDDLPALDNDDLRRGQPTCHKAYGEATAILAGDALLTLAFAELATAADAGLTREWVRELAGAAGTPLGMVGGQMADLEATRETANEDTLLFVHRNKTGALIRAAVLMGAQAGGASAPTLQELSRFGEEIGLAFQIVDDILDVTSSSGELGKTAGKDEAQEKVTYPALFGLEQAREDARRYSERALGRLTELGDRAQALRLLAEVMVRRRN